MSLPAPTLRQLAESSADAGRVAGLLALSRQLITSDADNADALLDMGALLLALGYLSPARACLERARALAPGDDRVLVNLASLSREAGDHAQSQRLYQALQAAHPNDPVIRRNALVSQQYDPEVPDAVRLQHIHAWGRWAVAQAGGERPRPARAQVTGPLRIGYVSADLCQHTVGLFLLSVLLAHDARAVQVFAYSAGAVSDWLTDAMRKVTTLRDVAALNDADLAALIRQDQIDVLVDLSGHTAGSRLTVFAHQPAPVQVSWLGYFASTGLPCMDAVLMDGWHVPAGLEAQFAEPVVRLPMGRFCYRPVPWAPGAVSGLPAARRGYITFGCFNNTAKLNAGVFDVWARVLTAVPGARLVLKWRTLVDDGFCQSVRAAFAARGIEPERLDLRPASPHADALGQYADIDIALDPFPFTGGLTSCEALWMGVPVVTWPQSRAVSRQTFALLSAIGLAELAADSADGYVHIAQSLAANPARLVALRSSLRARMQSSPLMDVAGFTRQLERTLRSLHSAIGG